MNIKYWVSILAVLCLFYSSRSDAIEGPMEVKVFIAAMFEIGANSGDKAGEFQHWYERYFSQSQAIDVKGALNPVYCTPSGICGSVLGMGKVASSSSMQAILLNSQFDMSASYFILSGVGGTPPTKGTIGDVSWGSWLVDYDLGHRWDASEGEPDAPTFMPRKGYEEIRRYQLDPILLSWAYRLSSKTQLKDSPQAQKYRMAYPQVAARQSPAVKIGTHMTGDTFFHGPGLSKQAQYMTELYATDDYLVTEMEAAAITQVIKRNVGLQRIMSLRGAVNFDQGNPHETTLAHLDPAPGKTAGGFAETVENIMLVGTKVSEHIVKNWQVWKMGVPAINKTEDL